MKKITLGLVLAILTMPAAAESYFTGEVMLGSADQKTIFDDSDFTSGDDISLGIRGAYVLNKFVAFEVAYQDYGQTDDTYIDDFGDTINDRVSASAFNAGLKGLFPVAPGFAVHARVGISLWDIKVRSTDSFFPDEVFKSSDDGHDFYYGVGGQMDIGDRFILGAEYTVIDMDISFSGVSFDHEIRNLTLTFGMRF